MLGDFLSKNPGKKEIFGDGTSDNPGLLGQIIENPEYYNENKKIVDRIYEEYVRLDETLSEDAKEIIREKLNFLAGKAPVIDPGTKNPENNNDPEAGFMSKLKSVGIILVWILLAAV